jgi:beta-lactamase superfamily II metal-dependent hydrolase
VEYEIDFHPVGDPGDDGKCRRSGDAISLRFGELLATPRQQIVVVIDGGFRSSGEKMCEHIKQHYGTDTIDWVFCSHSHDDHIQGLFLVLETLKVKNLLIRQPWKHADGVMTLLEDDRTTQSGTKQRLKESFRAAWDLCRLAESKDIPILEPFAGTNYTPGGQKQMLVLGPSEPFYHNCLAAELAEEPLGGAASLKTILTGALQAAFHAVSEMWDQEKLVEPAPDAVSPLNNSSTVVHFTFGEVKILFTADAGVQGLTMAHEYAISQGIDLRQCTRVQVPHHGSKRNVGPAILNKLLGPVLALNSSATRTGMVSCARDGEPKHPSARVTNAFLRRGLAVTPTKGQIICYTSPGMHGTRGWTQVTPIPFQSTYSEED